ncbi:hypothetical protein AO384_0057 [Moraxella catarrhalis]|uniref:Uncharacterized protein n=1 Tax=Moraxella catarrhalis TaxID=480 RepID=A0A198UPM8_MORCA|nr:hypothetical protein AO384_0057 [Moraxella catarrhalis]
MAFGSIKRFSNIIFILNENIKVYFSTNPYPKPIHQNVKNQAFLSKN